MMFKNSSNRILAGGVLSLFIAIGVGRFAYTPILPLMQMEQGLSGLAAGNIASANYLGYLVGALLASVIPWRDKRGYYLKLNLAISLLTTGIMGLSSSMVFWLIVRFISGCSSSIIFVLASSIVIDLLNREHKQPLIGVFYSGVGLGIAFTGLAVPWLNASLGWQGAWIGLSLLSAVLAVIPFIGIPSHNNPVTAAASSDQAMRDKSISVTSLIVVYGLEGFGYVITATFIVAMLREMFTSSLVSSSSWVIVGLAAAPSCFLWAKLSKRFGYVYVLMSAYLVQAVAVILPLIKPDAWGALTGALLFGGTFMGITTIANALMRNLKPENSSRFIGYLTAAYGLGQIIGPLIAGFIFDVTRDFDLALILAFATLLLALALMAFGSSSRKRS